VAASEKATPSTTRSRSRARTFVPGDIETFRLTRYHADHLSGNAVLEYSLDDTHHFAERVDFGRGVGLAEGTARGFESVVRLLHLAAGVSYFKAASPKRILVETGGLTEEETSLVRDLYDKGMREFAYRNSLEVPLSLSIETSSGAAREADGAQVAAPEPGIAVPIGGGKDSIVVLEALREMHPRLVSVNPSRAAREVASVAGLGLVEIERTIDPHLLELNTEGALNGHVPVTAIVSLISIAAGYLYGYDTTAVALESSADEPTRVVSSPSGKDVEVNHQWSKSSEFERALQTVLARSVHPKVRFLSPLRRFSELEITGAFASFRRYAHTFRSCNATARMAGASEGWCCDCPKCRFVYLALAPHLLPQELEEMFGADLLGDETQVEGYLEMLDASAKPFECVGTVGEVLAAFRDVLSQPEWSDKVVPKKVRPHVEASRNATPELASPEQVLAGTRQALTDVSVR
jgi:hypothetical protein